MPSDSVTYERARRFANIACWVVALQCRRISSDEPEDSSFLLRRWADFDFLVVALTRLRRAAALAAKVPEIKTAIEAAIKSFDEALPDLKDMRNVAEHFDDYAVDEGRKTAIRRQSLEVVVFGKQKIEWLDFSLQVDDALQASSALFEAIKLNKPGGGDIASS
jgi:hypothetical protein